MLATPHPGRYRVDPDHSTIAVRTRHLFNLGAVNATVALRGGEIDVAERLENSRVEARADAAGFDSGDARRDRQVRGLLDAGRHPEIKFQSDSVRQSGGRWLVSGVLDVRGRRAPLELTVTESAERPGGMTIVATGRVDRYAHDVTRLKGMAARYLDLTVTVVARPTD